MVRDFFAPSELKEALALKKSTRNSFYLAGGTVLNAGRRKTEISVISLQKLDLAYIRKLDGCLQIGSMVTLQDIVDSSVVKEAGLGELQESCRAVSKGIRNLATIGGSIAANYSRSDVIPVLVAASARCIINTSDTGEGDEMALEDYLDLRARGQSPLIREIKIPVVAKNCHVASRRFARTSMDLPVVKVAAALTLEGTRCREARIALGGLSDHVSRLKDVESLLAGRDLATLKDELGPVMKGAPSLSPSDDIRGTALFKKHLALVLLEEIITGAAKEEH
jgi:probable selenate reductase FAD-binding subunit